MMAHSTPCLLLSQVVQRMRAIASKSSEFEAARKAADSPYSAYVAAKKQECEWPGQELLLCMPARCMHARCFSAA
jgi:hypothetical protein